MTNNAPNIVTRPGTKLEIEIVTTRASSLHTNHALIKGERSMILVDAPFSRADTHRLIGDILETGKDLEKIIITHDHPDHFFGLDLLLDTFPNAVALAHPSVVEDILIDAPRGLDRWQEKIGKLAPRYVAIPKAWDLDHVMLEDERIELVGPVPGDANRITMIWVPQLKTLVASDVLFNEVHLWFGEHFEEHRGAWLKALDQIKSLDPEVIVAGHKRPHLPDDITSWNYTRDYILGFEKHLAEASDSADLAKRIERDYPETVDVLDGFLLGNSTKVAMREIPPVNEP
ncbi:beta-lactamase-like protein [Sphingopyxis fribergensis]|uniref:Beta-lactamase-like protein n=1 Tax=Sphingopyxis fribergensis TaxID=1515612 RepID=A0A0A7PJS1_9SPHN|nr:MBL fold metallo-hydrolase [Sphingopyxis fribergensis]AJA09498.1 beta-lactamase-like protein [Sphingopyxis fribergensis]